jgi:hypothetical protein
MAARRLLFTLLLILWVTVIVAAYFWHLSDHPPELTGYWETHQWDFGFISFSIRAPIWQQRASEKSWGGCRSPADAGVPPVDTSSIYIEIPAPPTPHLIDITIGGMPGVSAMPQTFAAPELDPASLGGALTLLGGGLLVLRGRRSFAERRR